LINFPLPQSWAGEIPIGAPYGNDTLFFWLWEAQAGAWSDDLISELRYCILSEDSMLKMFLSLVKWWTWM
jgi:hypothetical protein